MFFKIQLGKNSFEMLKLPFGGDKDADKPFYLKTTKTQFLTFMIL